MAEADEEAVYAPPGDPAAAAPLAASAKEPGDLPAPPRRSFVFRAAVTLGAAAVAMLLEKVPLPGIDPFALAEMAGGSTGGNLSIVALGVMPVLSAYVLVELGALAVPRWRGLRHGGPPGRARLDRAAALLTLVLSVFQGYGIAQLLRSSELLSGGVLPVIVTLTAGTFLLWAIAGTVTRQGLGNGIVWLYTVGALRDVVTKLVAPGPSTGALGSSGSPDHTASIPAALVAIAASVAATVLVLRSAAPPRDEAAPGPAEGAPPLPLAIPAPASGLAPLYIAPSLLVLPATLAALNVPVPASMNLDGAASYAATALLTVLAGATFGFLFHVPERVSSLLSRLRITLPSPAPGRAATSLVGSALPATIAYLLCMLCAMWAGPGAGVSAWPLIVAWVLDALRAHRARRAHPTLVTVWTDERPFAAAAARAALSRRGIPSHAESLLQRTLLQFGNGAVPIEIQVPAADAPRARSYLSAALPDPTPEKDAEILRTPAEDRTHRESEGGAPLDDSLGDRVAATPAAPSRGVMLALVALAGGMFALTVMTMPPAASPPGPPTAADLERRRQVLQMVLVDDGADPLEPVSVGGGAPRGVRFQQENAPVGPGSTRPVYHAIALLQEGESKDALAGRIQPWLAGIAVPAGTRLELGEYTEFDEETEGMHIVGLRTYLLRGEPFLTGADVVTAAAFPDRARGGQGWTVAIELTPESAERFREITAANVKRRFAIVVEGRVASAPVVQQEIRGGRVVITIGAGSPAQQMADAQRLARALGDGR